MLRTNLVEGFSDLLLLIVPGKAFDHLHVHYAQKLSIKICYFVFCINIIKITYINLFYTYNIFLLRNVYQITS